MCRLFPAPGTARLANYGPCGGEGQNGLVKQQSKYQAHIVAHRGPPLPVQSAELRQADTLRYEHGQHRQQRQERHERDDDRSLTASAVAIAAGIISHASAMM